MCMDIVILDFSRCVAFVSGNFHVQALDLKFSPHGLSFSIKSSYRLCLFQTMKLLTILWRVSFLALSNFCSVPPIHYLSSMVFFLSISGLTVSFSNYL